MSILSLLYTQGGKKERVDIYSRVVIPLAHEEQQQARKKRGGGWNGSERGLLAVANGARRRKIDV
jgi:hypothetical protein